jgi:hypothetical protein
MFSAISGEVQDRAIACNFSGIDRIRWILSRLCMCGVVLSSQLRPHDDDMLDMLVPIGSAHPEMAMSILALADIGVAREI